MTRGGRRSLLEALCIVVGVVGAFWLLQQPVREAEARLVAQLADWLGRGTVFSLGTTILIFPTSTQIVSTTLLPSCSSLSSALAALVLFALGRNQSLGRRFGAAGMAVGLVVLGNMLRLVASLVVGTYGGRFALVAFHDVIGGTFTFIYVIGGFVVGLFLLLPKDEPLSADDKSLMTDRDPLVSRDKLLSQGARSQDALPGGKVAEVVRVR